MSRSWIYKYVGPSQDELIEFAIGHFGTIMSQLDQRDNPKTPKEWIASTLSGTKSLFDLADGRPWLVNLYFRYRGTPSVPGKRIEQLEKQYVRVFAQETTAAFGFSETYATFLAKSLMAVRMGLAHQWVTSSNREPAFQAKLLELVEVVLLKMVKSN